MESNSSHLMATYPIPFFFPPQGIFYEAVAAVPFASFVRIVSPVGTELFIDVFCYLNHFQHYPNSSPNGTELQRAKQPEAAPCCPKNGVESQHNLWVPPLPLTPCPPTPRNFLCLFSPTQNLWRKPWMRNGPTKLNGQNFMKCLEIYQPLVCSKYA